MSRQPARMTRSRTLPRPVLVAVALAVALLGWVPAQPAGAHGQLVSSQPAGDGLVEVMPSRAFLTFSDPVKEVKEIAVVGPDGSERVVAVVATKQPVTLDEHAQRLAGTDQMLLADDVVDRARPETGSERRLRA